MTDPIATATAMRLIRNLLDKKIPFDLVLASEAPALVKNAMAQFVREHGSTWFYGLMRIDGVLVAAGFSPEKLVYAFMFDKKNAPVVLSGETLRLFKLAAPQII
jgi:hypothetical protein